MIQRLLFMALLLPLIISCAVKTTEQPVVEVEVVEQNINAHTATQEAYDPDHDTVDHGCSYFYYLWGRTAELNGQVDEALEAYEKSLICDPDAIQVMRNLGMLLLKSGRTSAAVEWIDKLIDLDPENVQVRTLLAKLYASLNRTDDAIAEYKAVLAKQPDDSNVMLLLGTLYASVGRYNEALETLEKHLELDPESYNGQYYLARLHLQLRDFDKAIAAYNKTMEMNWSDRLAFEAASVYEQQGKIDDAIVVYKRVIEVEQGNEQARRLLVSAYMRQNKPDKALLELQELRDSAVDAREVDLVIGRLLLDLERYEEAISHFEGMLSTDREAVDVRALLVLAHYRRGDHLAAKNILLEVPPQSDSYEESIQMLTGILRESGNESDAEALLLERIAVEETRRPSFYLILADIYFKSANIEKTEKVFKDALAAFSQDVTILFDYSLFLDKIGRMEESLSTMENVLVLEPDNPFALNYVGYTWADNNTRLDEARQYIEKAVEQRPEDGYIRDSLGWVYFKLGDVERAVNELQKAIQLEPHDPTIYEHLGDALSKAGRHKDAADAYNRSMALHSEDEKKSRVMQKIKAIEGENPAPSN